MTNKKTALEQFVAFATNPADNEYTTGTMPIAQAFKELAERVEALEAKTSLIRESFADKMILLDKRVREIAGEPTNDARTIVELPDDTFDDLLKMGVHYTTTASGNLFCETLQGLHIGSTTFIRSKKESK